MNKKPIRMTTNDQNRGLNKMFSSLTGMLAMVCLVLGFGISEAQAQDPSASIYTAADGATISELDVEPGETFTLTFGVDCNVEVNAVNISFFFDESLLQIEEGSLNEVAPDNFNVPLSDATLDNENGYVFWEIGYISFLPPGEPAPPGVIDMFELTFTVNPDVVLSTTTELMFDMEESFVGSVAEGVQILGDTPPFAINIQGDEPAGPENDLPCDAIAVECGSVVDGSNVDATPDARCGSTTERLGVWYVLDLASEQIVSLETCLGQTNFDTDLSVFTGTCDDLTCFDGFSGNGHIDGPSDCDVQSWAAGGPGAVFTAPAGTYYIMVHGFGTSTSGDFTLSVTCEDPPACVPASSLNTDVVADDCVEGEGSYTVAVSFSDDGSAAEYVVSNDVNAETANVAADGSAEFTFPSGTEVNFTAVAVGFDDCTVTGSASFTCAPPAPANDLCGDAIAVVCNENVFGSNVGATNTGNPDIGFCGTNPGTSGVWYVLEGDGTEVVLSTDNEGTNYDTKLNVYSGSCEEPVCVGGDDDTGGLQSEVSFLSEEGVSYYILVSGFSDNTGNFELSISCEDPAPVPENDLPCNAIAVECGSVVDGSNENATPDERCGFGGERLGVWYVLELESEQIVSLETCLGQTNFDTDLSVFSGSCDDLTCFDGFSGDGYIDGESGCEVNSWAAGGDGAVFTAPAGTYYIMVHGFSSDLSGDFTLSVTCEPSEPVCDADGGFIGFADESDAQTLCADDAGMVDVIQSGATGAAFAWVVTDEDANVLDLPDGPPFDFSGAEDGTVLIWYLAFDPENSNVLEAAEAIANGAEINASDLEGCFALSNSIALTIETCFDCPEQEANEGDACDLGDNETGVINDNCECIPVVVPDCNNFVVYLADIGPDFVTDIYGVSFNGSDADLSLIATSETEVHIAYNEVNGLIYAVNKADGSYRTLDPADGTFGPLTMLDTSLDEIIGAVINADGKLILSSQSANTIYSVNLPNNAVSVFDSYSPILGGDIAFGQDGMLYLATREGGGTLFEAYPDEVLADQYVGDLPSLVTGLAVANNGQLLVSSRESGQIDVRNTDGSVDAPFNLMLNGESFESFNGDMASGCGDNSFEEDLCEDTGECYGVTVDYVQGTNQGGGAIAADRANPMNALGAPEGTDNLVFTTLGYGGSLTFQFDGVIPNGAGDDIEVVETSFNNPGCEAFPEYADVSVSVDGATYFYIGTVCKGDPFVDISDADVEIPFECVSYVRVANNDELTSTGDGFDVDGIVALHNCSDDEDEETALTSVEANNTLTSFPNPTSGLSQAVFVTAATERATLEVYDMNGRVVETLFNQVANANQEYRVDFDGMKLPNGVYVYRLTTDSEITVEKFMIAK